MGDDGRDPQGQRTSDAQVSDEGRVYYDFLRSELDREYERRASLQSRAVSLSGFGSAAIAMAGAVWALAFGKGETLNRWATVTLLVALLAFLGSALIAVTVFAIGQRPYKVADGATQSKMLSVHWGDTESAARRVAGTMVSSTLLSLRAGNNTSSGRVISAGWLQAAGLAAVIAVVLIQFAQAI